MLGYSENLSDDLFYVLPCSPPRLLFVERTVGTSSNISDFIF